MTWAALRSAFVQVFSYEGLGSETQGGVFKGRHFDRSVILLCGRWCLAIISPEFLERLDQPKWPTTDKWHDDETSTKVEGQWRHLYQAIGGNGKAVDFWFSERRNLTAAKRLLR